jgi:hypothetical protein
MTPTPCRITQPNSLGPTFPIVKPGQEQRAEMVRSSPRDGLNADSPAFLDHGRGRAEDQFRRCRCKFGETRDGEVLMVESFIIQQNFGCLEMNE